MTVSMMFPRVQLLNVFTCNRVNQDFINLMDLTFQSLTIPVNIRVTDANDNAPVFHNGPYHVSVSEVKTF